ncbi:MAG TPA: hypothetical protein VGM90_17415 [Kofleriaceae bacterium]|jgi:hypothetical protein
MAFDDLAKHMAARDGNKKAMVSGDGNQIVAEAAKANARLNRQRDLILGPILLVGGLVCLAFGLFTVMDDSAQLPSENLRLVLSVISGGAAGVIIGGRKLSRGLRNKSVDDTGEVIDVIKRPGLR